MKCSPPGYYQEFLEGLVKIDAEATRRFLVNLGSESYRTGRINDEFIHVVCSGFYAGLFEVVVHDMPREAAEGYIREPVSYTHLDVYKRQGLGRVSADVAVLLQSL